MNKAFQKFQGKSTASLIAVLLVACVLVFALAACAPADGAINNLSEPENAAAVEFAQSVSLSIGDAIASSETGNSVSKTITATVLPEDAPNKAVDWSVAWSVPLSDTAIVTDYVTVTPNSDGSLSATVTAYQGFEGATITISATTRVGGLVATCQVTYLGAPLTLVINCNGTNYIQGSTTYNSPTSLSAGENYTVPISLDNTLHAVGSQYGTYTMTLEGSGNFMATKKTTSRGSDPTYEEVSISVNDYVSQFVSASLIGGNLHITVSKALSGFYYFIPGSNGSVEYTYSGPHALSTPCFYITVTDTVSHTSTCLYFDIIPTTTAVSLSSSTMTF